MKLFLSKEHEENILNALEIFPSSAVLNNKVSTYSYGKGNWFYFSDSSYMCVLNLCTEDYSYCLRIDPGYKLIIVCDNNSTEYDDPEDDFENDNTFISNFYLEEEEYFMHSTIKEITIPFSIMKRSYEFLRFAKETYDN